MKTVKTGFVFCLLLALGTTACTVKLNTGEDDPATEKTEKITEDSNTASEKKEEVVSEPTVSQSSVSDREPNVKDIAEEILKAIFIVEYGEELDQNKVDLLSDEYLKENLELILETIPVMKDYCNSVSDPAKIDEFLEFVDNPNLNSEGKTTLLASQSFCPGELYNILAIEGEGKIEKRLTQDGEPLTNLPDTSNYPKFKLD
jgi:hypothetical protein